MLAGVTKKTFLYVEQKGPFPPLKGRQLDISMEQMVEVINNLEFPFLGFCYKNYIYRPISGALKYLIRGCSLRHLGKP